MKIEKLFNKVGKCFAMLPINWWKFGTVNFVRLISLLYVFAVMSNFNTSYGCMYILILEKDYSYPKLG